MVLDYSWSLFTKSYGHKGVTYSHVAAFVTGLFNFVLNAAIWWAFHKNGKLLTKSKLHLFYAFAVTNCLTGSSFEIALEKVRAILTLAIAAERMHAIIKPGKHYFMDHGKRICWIAVVLGIFDSLFLIYEDDLFTVRIHCVTTSSSGSYFHWYFLLSTIIAGVLLTILYVILICRLFVLKGYHTPLNRNVDHQARNQYRQANSLTVIVIFLVLIFSVLPCSLYLYDMVIFMQWGPIITIGYHLYGILSFFFYNLKHYDIQKAFQFDL